MTSQDYYYISPSEYEELLKKKRDEMRINRLVQMREATKIVRDQQKKQYITSKSDKEKKRNEILKQEWERERQEKIETLKRQLQHKQKMAGLGMKHAQDMINVKKEWASNAYWQYHEDEELRIKRGNEALKVKKDESIDKKKQILIQRKEMVKLIENERAEKLVEEKPYNNQENAPLNQIGIDGIYHSNLQYLQEKTQQLLENLKPMKQRDSRWNDRHNDYSKTIYHDRPQLVATDKPKSIVVRADPHSASQNAIEEAKIASEKTEIRLKKKEQQFENARVSAIRRAREAYQKKREEEKTENINQHLEIMEEADRKRKQREIGWKIIPTIADQKLETEKERHVSKDFELLLR